MEGERGKGSEGAGVEKKKARGKEICGGENQQQNK